MQPYTGTPTALRVSVTAFMLDARGYVLLQRRSDNGFWNMPGGGLELGENFETAVKREVFEETGLEVEVLRLIGVYSDPSITVMTYPDGRCLQYVSSLFECRVIQGALRVDHESLELGWFDPLALPEPFSPNHVTRLRDALDCRQAAFWR
ncbi:MAG: NUDIX domain-containing protein [Casimicrobium sp.]